MVVGVLLFIGTFISLIQPFPTLLASGLFLWILFFSIDCRKKWVDNFTVTGFLVDALLIKEPNYYSHSFF